MPKGVFLLLRLPCQAIARIHTFLDLHLPELRKIIILSEPMASFLRNFGEKLNPFICRKLSDYCRARSVCETLMTPETAIFLRNVTLIFDLYLDLGTSRCLSMPLYQIWAL